MVFFFFFFLALSYVNCLMLSRLVSSHLSSANSVQLSSYHLISSHLVQSYFISSYLISSRPILFHLISYHLISCHLISPHLISSHLILSHLNACWKKERGYEQRSLIEVCLLSTKYNELKWFFKQLFNYIALSNLHNIPSVCLPSFFIFAYIDLISI